MDVIPSIDIRGGFCVRLYQGDYSQETIFSDDPVQAALRWQSMGPPRLHIVDLDGAVAGKPGNMEIIRNLAVAMLIPTQLGGGIRDINTVKELLSAGLDRIILGTAAVEDTEFIKEACSKYGESIVQLLDSQTILVLSTFVPIQILDNPHGISESPKQFFSFFSSLVCF